MYFNRSSSSYTLIGTLFGKGYICSIDTVDQFEENENGLWNKVSVHVKWIYEIMEQMEEKTCPKSHPATEWHIFII